MDKETVIRTLRAHDVELRAEGISHVCLFGSVARGEAGKRSDVDLFYDYDPDRFGFLQVHEDSRTGAWDHRAAGRYHAA